MSYASHRPGEANLRLYHLHLHVHDVNTTRAFYETYFGFRQVLRDSAEVFLGSDDGLLLAIVNRSASDAPLPEWFHLGYQASSAEQARSLFRRMIDDGVAMAVSWTEFATGTVKFHCIDPNGYRVEVRWDAPKA